MHLRLVRHALFLLGISLAGCKDKPDPQGASVRPDIPPPPPSASAIVAPAPSASVVEVAPAPAPVLGSGPKLALRYHMSEKAATLHWLGTGIVTCDNQVCLGDAQLVTEKGVTDTYDPTQAMLLKNPKIFDSWPGHGFDYWGVYPDVCTTVLYMNDRTDSRGITMKRSGKSWVEGTCPEMPLRELDKPPPRAPRDLDDALLHAPIANAAKTILRGAGAPPMLVGDAAVYVWDGKTWAKHDIALRKWSGKFDNFELPLRQAPQRLTNGATLVFEGGFYIDAKGEASPLQLLQDDKPMANPPIIIGAAWSNKFPWFIGMDDKDVYLFTPDATDKTNFTPAPIPERVSLKNAAPAPANSALAAPSASALPEPALSASAAAAGSANAPPSSPLELKPFAAGCSTPFLLLASPPKPGQAYATTREGLRGHGEFQDRVTFVEFVLEGKTYFGAQARTEADAQQFTEVVEKNVKGMKPQLRCVDVVGQIPDRYAPPEGMRIVGINLTTGELVPFD